MLSLRRSHQRIDHNIFRKIMAGRNKSYAEIFGVDQFVVLCLARHKCLTSPFGGIVQIIGTRTAAKTDRVDLSSAVGIKQPVAAERSFHKRGEFTRFERLFCPAEKRCGQTGSTVRRQRFHRKKTEPCGKAGIHSARREVEVRVRADRRDSVLRQQIRRSARPAANAAD